MPMTSSVQERVKCLPFPYNPGKWEFWGMQRVHLMSWALKGHHAKLWKAFFCSRKKWKIINCCEKNRAFSSRESLKSSRTFPCSPANCLNWISDHSNHVLSPSPNREVKGMSLIQQMGIQGGVEKAIRPVSRYGLDGAVLLLSTMRFLGGILQWLALHEAQGCSSSVLLQTNIPRGSSSPIFRTTCNPEPTLGLSKHTRIQKISFHLHWAPWNFPGNLARVLCF